VGNMSAGAQAPTFFITGGTLTNRKEPTDPFIDTSALFILVEIINASGVVVWSRMIRLSTPEVERIVNDQLAEVFVTFEEASSLPERKL